MINGKSVLKAGDAYQNYGLLNNTDLNTLTGTKFGFYGQITDANATSSSNYPIQLAGNLAVYQNYADIGVEGCTQVYYTYSNSRIFIRNYFSRTKTWTKWAEKITTANINNYLPIGIPQPWPCNQPPEGWLECNGSGFNKNQFPKLGAAYPQGFLPDLRGEFIRGWDNARGVDKERGILKWQAPQISAHKHVGGWGENRSDYNSSQMQRSIAITAKYLLENTVVAGAYSLHEAIPSEVIINQLLAENIIQISTTTHNTLTATEAI